MTISDIDYGLFFDVTLVERMQIHMAHLAMYGQVVVSAQCHLLCLRVGYQSSLINK